MNENDDLQRLFFALRTVDQAQAPPFEELVEDVSSPVPEIPERRQINSPLRNLVAAAAVSLAFGILTWVIVPASTQPSFPSAKTELKNLNHICDTLLARIESTDFPEVVSEMEWSTRTDSLLPFETLTFHERPAP